MKEMGQSTSPLFFQEREVLCLWFSAVSGSQQQASSIVMNPRLSADLWGTRKLVPGISSVEGTLSRGKRARDLESVQSLSERRNLHAYLEQKAELAVPVVCAAQRRENEA